MEGYILDSLKTKSFSRCGSEGLPSQNSRLAKVEPVTTSLIGKHVVCDHPATESISLYNQYSVCNDTAVIAAEHAIIKNIRQNRIALHVPAIRASAAVRSVEFEDP